MKTNNKILVVDDEVKACRLFQNFLEKGGYSVQSAYAAEKALSQIHFFQPDLILLDIRLPGISGDELLKTILDWQPKIKIIMVTGLTDPKLHQRCLENGAYAVLEKPVDFKLLLNAIQEALSSPS